MHSDPDDDPDGMNAGSAGDPVWFAGVRRDQTYWSKGPASFSRPDTDRTGAHPTSIPLPVGNAKVHRDYDHGLSHNHECAVATK